MKRFILDTDILINWLRGQSFEKNLLLTSGIDFYYSRVSRKELFQYKSINQKEKKKILFLLNCLREIPISSSIAQKASELLNKYKHKPLTAADALIAASAWDKNLTLISHNIKHYSFISEIKLNEY
jgi:predicted nucleic acid-binding protein